MKCSHRLVFTAALTTGTLICGCEWFGPSVLTANLQLITPVANFWQVASGESASCTVYVLNEGDADVNVLSAVLSSGEFQITSFDQTITAHSLGRVHMSFAPIETGTRSATLDLVTDPPTASALSVPILAEVVAPPSAPFATSTSIDVTEQSVVESQQGVRRTYLVEVSSVGELPGGSLQLGLQGSLSPIWQATFDPPQLAFAPVAYSVLTLTAPPIFDIDPGEALVCGQPTGAEPPPFAVCEEDGTPVPAPEGGDLVDINTLCDCPPPPPATLNRLAFQQMTLPDAMPPEGAPPSANPVATVSVEIKGPKPGECCKSAKFEMTLTVDSQVMARGQLESNDLTAWFLASGLCGKNDFQLSAKTNGAAQAINPGPNNVFNCNAVTTDIAAVTRVELVTTKTVAATCEAPPVCPCFIPETKFVTKFTLGGEEVGAIEVYWQIGFAGTFCAVALSSASIDAIVFTRNDDVYDPGNDEYIEQDGDPDGDGKNSHTEVINGTDPQKK